MERLLATVFVLLLGAATGLACNPPFQQVGNNCYYIETQKAVGWEEARTACQTMGHNGLVADLAVFSSCDEFTLFTGVLGFSAPAKSTFWVGAHTMFVPNNWRWLNGEALSTGVPFWAYRQGHEDGEDCAAMDSESFFQLSDFPCSEARNYVCQVPATTLKQKPKEHPPPLDCPHDSVQVGEFCYWFSNDMLSWDEAETFCRNNFSRNLGELFSPSSCDEFTKMAHHLEIAENDKSHWAGAADASGDQEWFWVSGDVVPGGSPFWATNEPDEHYHSNYCGYMSHYRRFYLADEKCYSPHYFICKLHTW